MTDTKDELDKKDKEKKDNKLEVSPPIQVGLAVEIVNEDGSKKIHHVRVNKPEVE